MSMLRQGVDVPAPRRAPLRGYTALAAGHGRCCGPATCTDAGNRLEQKWPQTLWIVRHGQSAGNVARDAAELGGLAAIDIADRDVDVPLSPLGEQQADALGDWFADLPDAEQPEVVLSSPYVRACQTGDRVLAALQQHARRSAAATTPSPACATSGCARRSSASSTA